MCLFLDNCSLKLKYDSQDSPAKEMYFNRCLYQIFWQLLLIQKYIPLLLMKLIIRTIFHVIHPDV